VVKHSWSLDKTKKNIIAHIDYVKFGDKTYGYGFGGVDIISKDTMTEPKI
jgi:hypothetical protein